MKFISNSTHKTWSTVTSISVWCSNTFNQGQNYSFPTSGSACFRPLAPGLSPPLPFYPSSSSLPTTFQVPLAQGRGERTGKGLPRLVLWEDELGFSWQLFKVYSSLSAEILWVPLKSLGSLTCGLLNASNCQLLGGSFLNHWKSGGSPFWCQLTLPVAVLDRL